MTSLIAPDEHLHQVPDVLGDDLASFLPPDGTRRRTIAVVGSGYSAATTLGNLLDLAASRGHTYTLEIEWLVRKPTAVGAPYAQLEDDPLPSRQKLVSL
jgi:lysine/ornithine N-monooxygenase